MSLRSALVGFCAILLATLCLQARSSAQSSSSSSPKRAQPTTSGKATLLDPGTITNGVYRNSSLGFSCKIPAGWVRRTDEMNSRDDAKGDTNSNTASAPETGGRVLLAAFSRPPEARGEEVNSSIVIAAEEVGAYPGLKEAAQYFGPLTEVATAQGFAVDQEPYEIALGTKSLVRGDFHKDVGTRVMRQSTLAMLARGYAISFTFIGGTEDELEELIDGLSFSTRTSAAHK
jgi:hypothetical protein